MATAKKTAKKKKKNYRAGRIATRRAAWIARHHRDDLNRFVQRATVELAVSGRLSLQQAQKAAEVLCASLVDAGWFHDEPGVWFTREGLNLRRETVQPGRAL